MSGVEFASGKFALGQCDMCARIYMLHQLIPEIYDRKPTGFLVCETCWDEDNPQLQLGRYPINDPQALRDARPTTNNPEERNLWGYTPWVGNPSTFVWCQTGVLTVNGSATNPLLDITGTV